MIATKFSSNTQTILKNCWIALAAFLLSFAFGRTAPGDERYFTSILLGFGTFVVYSLPSELNFDLRLRSTRLLGLGLALILALGFFGIQNLSALLILFVAFTLSFFYVSSFHFLKIPLRQIPYLKSSLIALCWVLVCVVFPQVNQEQLPEGMEVVALFCFFLALTVPFDIRDYDLDRGKLKTPVQLVGIFPAKLIALCLLLCCAFIVLFQLKIKINLPLFGTTLLYLGLLIILSKKKFPIPYYASILDSSIMLLALTYLFSSFF